MKRVSLLVGLLILVTTGTTQAQSRDGFWIGFGLGGGSLSIDDADDREAGGVGFLKMGGTINEKFLIGGESNVWLKEVDGVTITSSNFSAVAYFYPSATSGFFLKGGIGWARLALESGGVTLATNGGGAVFGIGYDWRVGDNVSVNPVLNFSAASYDGGNTNVTELAVGVTFH
jgi:hypothetical protein